ncbi:hypothetical protein HDU90_001519 [Geranomyces variabilis]|nr:hypothetical protein HDU90_001519 [Geranomyces variabilis]
MYDADVAKLFAAGAKVPPGSRTFDGMPPPEDPSSTAGKDALDRALDLDFDQLAADEEEVTPPLKEWEYPHKYYDRDVEKPYAELPAAVNGQDSVERALDIAFDQFAETRRRRRLKEWILKTTSRSYPQGWISRTGRRGRRRDKGFLMRLAAERQEEDAAI